MVGCHTGWRASSAGRLVCNSGIMGRSLGDALASLPMSNEPDTQSSTADDVLTKIKKLLRRSEERGFTEAEADQALAAAQRLAARHAIDLAAVDVSEEVGELEPFETEGFTPEGAGGNECSRRLPVTHQHVADILELYFSVRVVTSEYWKEEDDFRERRQKIELTGRRTAVSVGIYVYKFLLEEFRRRWLAYRKATAAATCERADFYQGVFWGLAKKLRAARGFALAEAQTALPAADPNRYALALVAEDERLEAETRAAHPRLRYVKRKETKVEDYRSCQAGIDAGSSIEIVTAITKKSKSA